MSDKRQRVQYIRDENNNPIVTVAWELGLGRLNKGAERGSRSFSRVRIPLNDNAPTKAISRFIRKHFTAGAL